MLGSRPPEATVGEPRSGGEPDDDRSEAKTDTELRPVQRRPREEQRSQEQWQCPKKCPKESAQDGAEQRDEEWPQAEQRQPLEREA